MVIFHSYVSLPEGNTSSRNIALHPCHPCWGTPTRPEFPGGGRSYRLSHPKKSLFKRQFFTSLEKLHNCFVKEKHPQEGVLVRNAVVS
jgi:hypothetical protein